MKPLVIGTGSCIVQNLIAGIEAVCADLGKHFEFKSYTYKVDSAGEPVPSQILSDELNRAVLLIEELPPWDPKSKAILSDKDRKQFGPDVISITLPTLHFNSLWPLISADPRNKPEPPRYPWGRYPTALTDRLALQMIKHHPLLEDRINSYKNTALESLIDLDSFHNLSVVGMFQREQACDIKTAAFIASSFHYMRLFYTNAHPCGPVYAYVLVQILGSKKFQNLYRGDWPKMLQAVKEWSDKLDERLTYEQAIIHPAVARHFNLKWWSPEMRYNTPMGDQTTMDEWLACYMS